MSSLSLTRLLVATGCTSFVSTVASIQYIATRVATPKPTAQPSQSREPLSTTRVVVLSLTALGTVLIVARAYARHAQEVRDNEAIRNASSSPIFAQNASSSPTGPASANEDQIFNAMRHKVPVPKVIIDALAAANRYDIANRIAGRREVIRALVEQAHQRTPVAPYPVDLPPPTYAEAVGTNPPPRYAEAVGTNPPPTYETTLHALRTDLLLEVDAILHSDSSYEKQYRLLQQLPFGILGISRETVYGGEEQVSDS